MAYIKRTVSFALERRKKDGVVVTDNVPIRMNVCFNAKRITFSTGYRIDEDKWNAAKQRVKSGAVNKQQFTAAHINDELIKLEADISEVFKKFEQVGVMPSPEQVKECFVKMNTGDDLKEAETVVSKRKTNDVNIVVKKKAATSEKGSKSTKSSKSREKQTLFDIYDLFFEQMSRINNWTKASRQKYAAQRNHLLTFKPDLTFEYLTEDGLNCYVEFLRDKLEMRNSTIEKRIAFLKTFLKWATRKGYNKNEAFESFKPRLKNIPKKVIFLTKEELDKLQEYEIPEKYKYLEKIRDVFLFCCFSGLRYSDVFNLRRCDVYPDRIVFTTVKTHDSLQVNLNKYTKAILDKYADVHFPEDKALPVISNQKMNDYLKQLAKMAGIDEQVHISYYRGNERVDEYVPKYTLHGTHAGRRTFVCNALALGIPANVVMKWTGHSDYKAMKPYVDIADQIKADMMTRFDNL